MTNGDAWQDRAVLRRIAHRAMLERGLSPEIPEEVLLEAAAIPGPLAVDRSVRDLRELLWCSIDNADSQDLDQLTVAEPQPGGEIKILVAIADVDAYVARGSIIDAHAWRNTTSVYTVAEVFPMLPERLSTDLSSLNPGVDRLALVIEMLVAADGSLVAADIYCALVHNKCKLAYDAVAGWLEGAEPPAALARVNGLASNLRLQDEAAQKLRALRYLQGALELVTIEPRAIFDGDELVELRAESKNRARELIEDFMIAANGVTARFLAARGLPSLRRVVNTPRRWDRIVELAAEQGSDLPSQADARALAGFLAVAREQDPLRFPDLSLSIIKLLGAGEYAVELPGEDSSGHFGLAVKDYAHSTAPNRRYPDLITQRLLKAALAGAAAPYSHEELQDLANHCTFMEDAARRVERQLNKSAAAMLMQSRLGDQFEAIVTGITATGTWVRVLEPPVEGRLERGYEGLDVGRRLRVQLLSTDVTHGYIDFKRAR